MTKKLLLILALCLTLPSCDEVVTALSVAGVVGLAGNAVIFFVSEHTEVKLADGTDTINLKVGETKPLKFNIKIIDEDMGEIDKMQISLTENNDIAGAILPTSSGQLEIYHDALKAERIPTGDPKIRKLNTPDTFRLVGKKAGETELKFAFKLRTSKFRVIVTN